MILIGIDPGKKGAIAEIDTIDKCVRWMRLPYRDDGVLDSIEVKSYFCFGSAHRIALEDVCYIKGANGAATFSFGKNFGMTLAMLEYYPYELIRPQAWHKRINGSKTPDDKADTKARSRASFLRLNPDFGKIIKEHHEGMIDAFFIAYFCGLLNNLVMPNGYTFQRVP
jgi:hypothetical protein